MILQRPHLYQSHRLLCQLHKQRNCGVLLWRLDYQRTVEAWEKTKTLLSVVLTFSHERRTPLLVLELLNLFPPWTNERQILWSHACIPVPQHFCCNKKKQSLIFRRGLVHITWTYQLTFLIKTGEAFLDPLSKFRDLMIFFGPYAPCSSDWSSEAALVIKTRTNNEE